MQLSIRQAVPQDVDLVADILREAARWLEDRGIAMWRDDELLSSRIADDVHSGLFFLAECNGEPVGTIRFQLTINCFGPI